MNFVMLQQSLLQDSCSFLNNKSSQTIVAVKHHEKGFRIAEMAVPFLSSEVSSTFEDLSLYCSTINLDLHRFHKAFLVEPKVSTYFYQDRSYLSIDCFFLNSGPKVEPISSISENKPSFMRGILKSKAIEQEEAPYITCSPEWIPNRLNTTFNIPSTNQILSCPGKHASYRGKKCDPETYYLQKNFVKWGKTVPEFKSCKEKFFETIAGYLSPYSIDVARKLFCDLYKNDFRKSLFYVNQLMQTMFVTFEREDSCICGGICVTKNISFAVLKAISKEAFNLAEPSNYDLSFLSALFIVNFASFSQFEDICGSNLRRNRRVFDIVAKLLQKKNQDLVLSLSLTNNFENLEEKREIAIEILQQRLKGCTSAEKKLLKKWGGVIQNNFSPMLSCKQSIGTNNLTSTLQLICADGTIYDRERDPPGQRSVYIAPGDQYHESYRLSTFIKFPVEVPVNPRHLANSGFFYTGYKDRVKCFSCGLCVENWVVGDDVRSPRWHRSDCAHAHGGDSGNVPIGGGGLARFLVPTTAQTAPSFSNTPITAGHPSRTQTTPTTRSNPLLQSGFVRQQTARPPPQSASIYQIVEFATIASAYHEHFLKSIDLRKESERIRTFEHFPTDAPTVTTHDLARSGFFYLGNLDRVQCFSCGGVLRNWNYGDSVQSEHRRHFPSCKLVQNNEPRNVPLTSDERAAIPQQTPIFTEPPDPPQAERQDLRAMFPCEYPVSPHMRNEDSRFQTFDERWSANNVQATPQQISKAGFFYLGERDRVKCWYCNGGLQNWDPQDEPWTEHAKWFPTCEFLLQRKGPDFVHRMVSMFPNLPRPLLRGPFDVPPTQGGARIQFGSQSNRAPTPPPQIIDPQEEIRREQERVNAAMQLDIVKAALELGFADRLVRKVVKRRIHRTEMYRTTEDLVSDLTAENEVNDSDSEASNPASPAAPSTSHEPMESLPGGDTESMQDRIRELQEERKCKICLDRLADIVFVPCGHLCCCDNCATSVKKCPMCRKKIDKAIRTYMS